MTRRVEFYTPADVAERLKVSTATICVWRQKGYGPKWFKVRSTFLYAVSDFNKYLHDLNGGHPIPDMTTLEKAEFFRRFHNPGSVKAALAARMDTLEDRLAVVELALDMGVADGPARPSPKESGKPKRRRRTARLGMAGVVLPRVRKRKRSPAPAE